MSLLGAALHGDRKPDRQRETYSRGQPFTSGETVTPGRFRCLRCDCEHEVPAGRATNLPICPRCHGERWEPV